MKNRETLQLAAGWLATFLVPFALVLTAVRLLLTPAWINIEYRTPNFPEDRYGFNLEDRLKWSIISLEYLLGNESLEAIQSYQLDDGAPMYNEREIRHLVDTGNIVDAVLWVWFGSIFVIALVGLAARRWRFWDSFRRALTRGGWVTLWIVEIVLVFVVLAFGAFFVFFHEIFFPPGTWTFNYSDTFIRLFPQRFWQDAFLWVGAITILEALWMISLTRQKPK